MSFLVCFLGIVSEDPDYPVSFQPRDAAEGAGDGAKNLVSVWRARSWARFFVPVRRAWRFHAGLDAEDGGDNLYSTIFLAKHR